MLERVFLNLKVDSSIIILNFELYGESVEG